MTHSVATHREMTDVERVFRGASSQAMATLVRVFGDTTFAEDAVQEAFVVAGKWWQSDGVPPNPAGGSSRPHESVQSMTSVARLGRELHRQLDAVASTPKGTDAEDRGEEEPVSDDQLRLSSPAVIRRCARSTKRP